MLQIPSSVRQMIGCVQQDTSVDDYLTGRENLYLQARLSHIPKSTMNSRIDDILSIIELEGRQHDPVVSYSGGMRKRLEIAGGLLHRPNVLFLDEPTVGLDIQTRRKIWGYIQRIRNEYGTTIFLTTHYMEEADRLCGRVGIMDNGRIQQINTPKDMKDELGGEVITIGIHGTHPVFMDNLRKIGAAREIRHDTNSGVITIFVTSGTEIIPHIFQIASDAGVTIESVSSAPPSLDDVFLSYTGHEIREDSHNENSKDMISNDVDTTTHTRTDNYQSPKYTNKNKVTGAKKRRLV